MEGGVRESEKLKKPEESTKSEESEETGEEGVSGKKVNDNGTDSDNDSDEETNNKKKKDETKEDEEEEMIAILGTHGKGDINDCLPDTPGTEHNNVRRFTT